MDTAEIVYISSLALLKVCSLYVCFFFMAITELIPETFSLIHTLYRCSNMVSVELQPISIPKTLMFVFSLTPGRAGVPMEVMGLMLGEFVDDYTVRVIDVFAMPQSGTVRISDLP